jgi:hypothetical protein
MVQSKNLAPLFWVEAINPANYILNYTPTKLVLNITPKED